MSFDSLTVAALVIFIIVMAVFIRIILTRVCGMLCERLHNNDADTQAGGR